MERRGFRVANLGHTRVGTHLSLCARRVAGNNPAGSDAESNAASETGT